MTFAERIIESPGAAGAHGGAPLQVHDRPKFGGRSLYEVAYLRERKSACLVTFGGYQNRRPARFLGVPFQKPAVASTEFHHSLPAMVEVLSRILPA